MGHEVPSTKLCTAWTGEQTCVPISKGSSARLALCRRLGGVEPTKSWDMVNEMAMAKVAASLSSSRRER